MHIRPLLEIRATMSPKSHHLAADLRVLRAKLRGNLLKGGTRVEFGLNL